MHALISYLFCRHLKWTCDVYKWLSSFIHSKEREREREIEINESYHSQSRSELTVSEKVDRESHTHTASNIFCYKFVTSGFTTQVNYTTQL